MTPSELMEATKDALAGRHQPPAGSLVGFGIIEMNGRPTIASARMEFLDARREPRALSSYDGMTLGEQWFDLDASLKFLSDLGTGSFLLAETAITQKFASVWVSHRTPARETLSGWSERVLEARALDFKSNSPLPSGPAVGIGLHPYPSAARALTHWLWRIRPAWGASEAPHLGEFVVVIPDTRGRIDKIVWDLKTLLVSLELGVPQEEIELQVVLHSPAGDELHRPTLHALSCSLDVADDVSAASAYLVHRGRGLLSHVEVDRSGGEFAAAAGVRSTREQASLDMHTGESDTVEFKPFIDVAGGGDKAAEVLETVVAFLNSRGGRLYLGIASHGAPQGPSALRKAAGTTPGEASKAEKDFIVHLITEKTKPRALFSIEWIEVQGDPVLAVTVERGGDRPYSTHSNDVFIRKGASNFKPDPRTELPALYPVPAPTYTGSGLLDQSLFG